VAGILAYFVHYLRMDNMSAPTELVFVRGLRHIFPHELTRPVGPRCRMHQPVGSNSRHLPTQSLPGFRAVQPICSSGRLESLVRSIRCIVLEIGRNGPFAFMYRQDMADLHGRHGLPIVQGHVLVFGD
jgi:hypothetical protein